MIRPYKPSDWLRLCQIHDAARLDELKNSVGIEAFIPLEQAAETEALFDYQVDVLEISGNVVGFVAYTKDELGWIYVDPAHYRRGYGRQLTQHVLNQATEPISVEVLVGNEPALKLYQALGFELIKRFDGQLYGNESFAASGYILKYTP